MRNPIALFCGSVYTGNMKEKQSVRYYRHKLENLLVVTKIVTIHYFEFETDFDSGGESHDFWEMVYVGRGEVECRAGENAFILRAGEAVFHAPDEYHRLIARGEKHPKVMVFSFECRSDAMRFFRGRHVRIPRALQAALPDIVEEARMTFDIPVSDPHTRKMEPLSSAALGGRQMIKNRLEMLLIELMRNASETGKDVRFLRNDEVAGSIAERILAVMEENLTSGLSVAELCEGIAYSRSYIFRQFRVATGQTMGDCYNRMKIDYAKELLLAPGTTISSVAELLRFDSANYFSKTFKRYSGMSPREWRADHAER